MQYFLPTRQFAGAIAGYVFKLGDQGLGYYLEYLPADNAGRSRIICLDDLIPTGPVTAELCAHAPTDLPRRTRRARRSREHNGRRKRWLTRRRLANNLTPMRIEDPEVTGLLDDKDWRKQGWWAIDSGNANSWKTAVDSILPRSSADVLLLQETRIFVPDRILAAERTSRASGWNPALTRAHALPSSHLGSGGCAVLRRRGRVSETSLAIISMTSLPTESASVGLMVW